VLWMWKSGACLYLSGRAWLSLILRALDPSQHHAARTGVSTQVLLSPSNECRPRPETAGLTRYRWTSRNPIIGSTKCQAWLMLGTAPPGELSLLAGMMLAGYSVRLRRVDRSAARLARTACPLSPACVRVCVPANARSDVAAGPWRVRSDGRPPHLPAFSGRDRSGGGQTDRQDSYRPYLYEPQPLHESVLA
jgi:hypothetical protein